eukprot:evm.model.scf_2886.1 EVM.evm.TU.scf_2886.1   scf_2886:10565-11704(-)
MAQGEQFAGPAYWQSEFYDDVDELFDWYSCEEWLTELVVELASLIAGAEADEQQDAAGDVRDEQERNCAVDQGAVPSADQEEQLPPDVCRSDGAARKSGEDWVGGEDWMVAMRAAGRRPQEMRVLDVGCGTCPLLFRLACQHGFRHLRGVDFAPRAIEVCQAELRRRAGLAGGKEEALECGEGAFRGHDGGDDDDFGPLPVGCSIGFSVLDALNLDERFGAGSVDVVVDKGCLDCFVSGGGERSIERFLGQVARVLAPWGVLVLVPVNGADIPRLLREGSIRMDRAAATRAQMGGELAGTMSAWERDKAVIRSGDFEQCLFLWRVISWQEKHAFVCRNSACPEPTEIECGVCRAAYPYPSGYPALCSQCSNQLKRFALS